MNSDSNNNCVVKNKFLIFFFTYLWKFNFARYIEACLSPKKDLDDFKPKTPATRKESIIGMTLTPLGLFLGVLSALGYVLSYAFMTLVVACGSAVMFFFGVWPNFDAGFTDNATYGYKRWGKNGERKMWVAPWEIALVAVVILVWDKIPEIYQSLMAQKDNDPSTWIGIVCGAILLLFIFFSTTPVRFLCKEILIKIQRMRKKKNFYKALFGKKWFAQTPKEKKIHFPRIKKFLDCKVLITARGNE